jgi:hypothetical protein
MQLPRRAIPSEPHEKSLKRKRKREVAVSKSEMRDSMRISGISLSGMAHLKNCIL